MRKYQRAQTRPIIVTDDVATIRLTRGFETMIDAADVPLVDGVHWQAWPNQSGNVYAARKVRSDGKRTTVRLHHLFFQDRHHDQEVDHINGNSLDNRRANLRLVSRFGNMRNLLHHRSGKDHGVRYRTARKTYEATITLGPFQTVDEANAAARMARQLLDMAKIKSPGYP